jgi:hypothetical protein
MWRFDHWSCNGEAVQNAVTVETGLTLLDLGCLQQQRITCLVAFQEFAPVYLPLTYSCTKRVHPRETWHERQAFLALLRRGSNTER